MNNDAIRHCYNIARGVVSQDKPLTYIGDMLVAHCQYHKNIAEAQALARTKGDDALPKIAKLLEEAMGDMGIEP